MSIYFQYPAKDDYPNTNNPLKLVVKEEQDLRDEDNLNQDQIIELKNYLALKQL